MNDSTTKGVGAPIDAFFQSAQLHLDGEDRDRNAMPHRRDLEDYIEILRQFAQWRKKSESTNSDAEYKGLQRMIEKINADKDPFLESLGPKKFDLDDYINAIRVSLEESESPKQDLILRLNQIADYTTLRNIQKQEYSVLLATNIMRALLSNRQSALSRPVFLCSYWIFREIYIAEAPDWLVPILRRNACAPS
jgi:hypothetical protein